MNIYRPALLLSGLLLMTGLNSCLNSDDVVTWEEQYEIDKVAIDQYILQKGYTGVKTDSSGYLRYLMLAEGTGNSPANDNWMSVNYEGSLLNNSVFGEGDSVYVKLDRVIKGWEVLMPYLKEGGEMIMFIPSFLGYGTGSSQEIPANSPLVFKVKLHHVFESQLDYEQARISDYLQEKGIVAETDPEEGLRYVITEEGPGEFVQSGDKINVDYDVKYVLDSAAKVRLSSQNVVINLATYLEGWKVLLPNVKAGSEVIMYLPSKYAYGSTGSANLEGNTPLIYRVKVNSIVE